jgi:hypothetical protein
MGITGRYCGPWLLGPCLALELLKGLQVGKNDGVLPTLHLGCAKGCLLSGTSHHKTLISLGEFGIPAQDLFILNF